MNVWKNEEVIALFKEVENCKACKQSMKLAFSKHAKRYGRKANSVRNYYYFELETLENDVERCETLNIDIKKHVKNRFELFNKAQEDEMVEKIGQMTASGMSVRSACFDLAGGDLTLMTRYQNKYQNIKKKSVDGKIIKFQNRQKSLTENDINSLFLGLVKLIKKTAVEDYVEKQKFDESSASALLKKALLDLNKKEKQIAQLKDEFEFLKRENERLNMYSQSAKEDFKQQFAKRRELKKENV